MAEIEGGQSWLLLALLSTATCEVVHASACFRQKIVVFLVMPIKPRLGSALDLDELFVHLGREAVDLLAWILL